MATEDEVLRSFGAAMRRAQSLEATLVAILLLDVLVERVISLAALRQDEVAFRDLIDDLDSKLVELENDKNKTLGRLIKDLGQLPPDFDRQLKAALKARTFLAHGFFKHLRGLSNTAEDRTVMVGVLSRFAAQIEDATGAGERLYAARCDAVGWPSTQLLSDMLEGIGSVCGA